MANKAKKIGQPEIMVAKTIVGRDSVTFSLPKTVLAQMNLKGNEAYFCVTNGVVQISGDVPAAVMPMFALGEDAFFPQGDAGKNKE